MKKLILLVLLIHSQQVFCQRDVFFSGNIYYYSNTTNTTKNNYYLSKSFVNSFSVKPSILWKTKKNKIREIELTSFNVGNRNTFIDSPDSSFNPRNVISNVDTRSFNFELTHRYYHNFLKKKSKKITLGFVTSNSIYLNKGNFMSNNTSYFNRKRFDIGSNFALGFGASYTIKKRFFIGLRRHPFLFISTGYSFEQNDNPNYALLLRKQKRFYFEPQIWYSGTLNGTILNLAYHFK